MAAAFRDQGLRCWSCCLSLLVLSLIMQRSAARNYPNASTNLSIKLVPESPVVGGDVILMVSSIGKIKMVKWYRAPGDAIYQNNVVLTYAPNSTNVTYGPKYTSRETGLPDASLKISNLMVSDTGNYTVHVVAFTGRKQQTVFLKVADGPPRRNTSSAVVIIGAIVGSLIASASLTIAAILLYKIYQSSKRRSHSKPFLHPHTQSSNFRTSVMSGGDISSREIRSPSHAYAAVLPALPKEKASLTQKEEDHVYTELQYPDQNPYSSLKR